MSAVALSESLPRPPSPGVRAPFRARAEPLAAAAAVEGTIPAWLAGDLVRVAPAIFSCDGPDGRSFRARHWFDALGLLYGFKIADGRVQFRQRLMATEVATQAQRGLTPNASFATPIERGFWRRLIEPRPRVTDNTNVNVAALGDQRVALTESPHQWAFDGDTLALTGRVEYDDALGRLAMSAHPHFDFATEKIVNVATELGGTSAIVVYEHAPASRTRREVGRVKLRRVPYVHSFGLTPRHAVLLGHPFTVSPLRLLWSNRGFIDHFEWRPGDGMTLWVMDRSTGRVRTHLAPACFVFHVVNAFEDGANTVLDVVHYPDATLVDRLRSDALVRDGLPALAPSIVRYTLVPGREHAIVETLLADGFDFPTVSYRQQSGQRHDVSWGVSIDADLRSTVVRLGADGDVRRYTDPEIVFGEPTFVRRPGAAEADAGVLLLVGAHRDDDRAELQIRDARTLELTARAAVPLPIPLGFHGTFFRAAGA